MCNVGTCSFLSQFVKVSDSESKPSSVLKQGGEAVLSGSYPVP